MMDLKGLVTKETSEHWTQEHIDRVGFDVAAAETLGVMVSVWTQWNGLVILRVAASALEDANFHQECAIVEQMREALEANDEVEFTLTVKPRS